MFNQIGKKIKTLATIFTIIGIVLSCIIGFTVLIIGVKNSRGDEAIKFVLIGLLIIIVGSLISWLMSFLLYGFGELIDETSRLAKHFCGNNTSGYSPFKNDAVQISKADNSKNTVFSCDVVDIPVKRCEEDTVNDIATR